MAGSNDSVLLREYTERQSESAFNELVDRHLNFVYSVALRYVGNPPDAEDVAQAVFVILVRKSDKLRGRTSLTSWLYETTRLTSRQFLRTRARRLAREQEAHMQSTLDSTGGDEFWQQLVPHLEDGMSRLRAADRELLALRFYENKTGEEAAALLGIGTAAAYKRTNRALEKLQKFFMARGVKMATASIAGAVSANSIHAAPAALAKTISTLATSKGVMAGGSSLALVKGVLNTMLWRKIKTVAFIGATLLATGMAGFAVLDQSQGNAKVPYRMLDDALQLIAGANQSNLMIQMTFTSQRVSQPTNIHLTIQSAKRGPIPVQLANDGQILNFPHDEELRRENPAVVSDLPKGSLTGTFRMRFPPLGTDFSYNRLGAGVAEIIRQSDR